MIVDGRAIAEDIYTSVAKQVALLANPPKLGVLTCAPNTETKQYLELKRKKAKQVGIELVILELPETAVVNDCIAVVERLAKKTDGVLVQLPLPKHIDREMVLAAVPSTQDPDGFAYGTDTQAVLPPVVAAIDIIAAECNVSFEDAKVVILGEGRLVGKPAAAYARARGGKVTVLTEDSEQYMQTIATADIIISGIGKPHFITPEMVRDGVIIFDAGASEDSGEVVGDVAPAVSKKASVFTPVPGGIGPITVATLLRNLLTCIHLE